VDSADDLQLAFDTSDLAADLALAYFESGVSATLKADGTPVTEADRAVERLFRETLSAARPEDALLGEAVGEADSAGRLECRWQREQLPDAIRELILDDQRLRNDICWSVFAC
jgi:fructose-1,6-bisphosphatase/inositol monophosphatase family enzyme